MIECLWTQYAPNGNELEWQFKLQNRMQKPGEQLVEFAGALRALADKAYPTWPDEQIKELLRNQFIQGLRSSSVQLELMKEKPSTLDEALQLANRQESIEAAQKRLHREQHHEESLTVNEKSLDDGQSESSTCASAAELTREHCGGRTDALVQQLTWLSKYSS